MNWTERIRRPEIWMEFMGVLLLMLWMTVLPHAHLYRLPYSHQLLMHTDEGKLKFLNNNKNGQKLLIGNQNFTCALDTIIRNTCHYRTSNEKIERLPVDLAGKNAVVQWTEVEAFPWQKLRVVIDLAVDGKTYRRAADFDRDLAASKKRAMQSDLFGFLLFSVYVWFRLTFRPKLYRQ